MTSRRGLSPSFPCSFVQVPLFTLPAIHGRAPVLRSRHEPKVHPSHDDGDFLVVPRGTIRTRFQGTYGNYHVSRQGQDRDGGSLSPGRSATLRLGRGSH